MKHHPIQLRNVSVEELSIVTLDRIKFQDVDYPKDFQYTIYSTEFNADSSAIFVKVELDIKPKDEASIDRPFSLKVVISGEFTVDQELFPMDMIQNFATHNAPIILMPYIREQAFGLTQRAGFTPIILPLVEVPTIKIVSKENDN